MPVADELKVILRAETAKAVRDMRKAQAQTDKTERGFGKLVGTLGKSVAGWAAAAVSIRAVTQTLRESVKLYSIQEEAEQSLTAALIATGKQAEISAEGIKQLASELQGVTTFGDEATISAAGMVQTLANLNEQQLRSILPRIQDFASAMGMDLNQAAQLVGKSIGSSTNALTRYGVEIDNSLEGTERFDALVTSLDSKFSGYAKTMANTATGSMQQFQNAVGDTKERIGELIAEGLQPAIEHFTDLFEDRNSRANSRTMVERIYGQDPSLTLRQLDQFIRKTEQLYEAEGGDDALGAQAYEYKAQLDIAEAMRDRLRYQEEYYGAMQDQAEATIAETRRQQAWNDLHIQRAALQQSYKSQLQSINEQEAQQLITAAEAEKARSDALRDTLQSARGVFDEYNRIADMDAADALTPVEPGDNIHNFIQELVRLMGQGGEDAGEAAAEGFYRSMDDASRDARSRMTPLLPIDVVRDSKDAADEMENNWKGAFTAISGSAMQTWSMINAAEAQRAANEKRRIDEQVKALSDRHERELAWAEAAGATDEELAQMKAEQLEAEQEAERQADKEKAKIAKKQFEREKGLKIAQTIQATALAVMQALAQLGPIAGAIAAGSISALGAKQLQLIASQEPPAFEKGGSFITNGPQTIQVGDGQSPRERVTVEPLTGPYARGGGGNTVHVHVNGVIDEEIAVKIKRAIERAEMRGAA